jgi:hypothetical protein
MSVAGLVGVDRGVGSEPVLPDRYLAGEIIVEGQRGDVGAARLNLAIVPRDSILSSPAALAKV